MSLELIQQRLEELSANLESLSASVENVARRARDAESTALSVESQVDDNLGEIQYLRDRTTQAEERVRDALLDIQGVNLEQRINEAILAKVQDGTITVAEVQQPALAGVRSIAAQILDHGLYEYTVQNLSPLPGGTHPVVDFQSNLSESESENVAVELELDVPDDGADQSETDSPDEVADDF